MPSSHSMTTLDTINSKMISHRAVLLDCYWTQQECQQEFTMWWASVETEAEYPSLDSCIKFVCIKMIAWRPHTLFSALYLPAKLLIPFLKLGYHCIPKRSKSSTVEHQHQLNIDAIISLHDHAGHDQFQNDFSSRGSPQSLLNTTRILTRIPYPCKQKRGPTSIWIIAKWVILRARSISKRGSKMLLSVN